MEKGKSNIIRIWVSNYTLSTDPHKTEVHDEVFVIHQGVSSIMVFTVLYSRFPQKH